MIFRTLVFCFCLAVAPVFAAAPNVLSNTDHAANDIAAAQAAISGTSIIDQSCATGGTYNGVLCGQNNSFVLPGAPFIAFSLGIGPFYTVDTASVVNDQPYTLLSESSTGYSLSLDQSNYNTLIADSIIYSMPHCPLIPGSPDYPPIAMVNVLPAGSGAYSVGNNCGYDSGTEFSIVNGYLYAGSASSPSASGGTMAGIIAKLKQDHSTWTWNDIKGALRQTASNWSGGYTSNNAGALGFGNVNYANATAISSTSAIYLQAPGMTIATFGYYALITLYPFMQTRRAREVVYIGGTWPPANSVNEMTAAQIAAAGGTKVVDDGGATGAQTFTYAAPATGSATFVALTLDSAGNGSRVESFNPLAESFVVGTACLDH